MRYSTFGLLALIALLIAGAVWYWSRNPPVAAVSPGAATTRMAPLRVGLIPERDILEQKKRYLALANYISSRLGVDVQLVTARTYGQVLADLQSGEIDAAFLGSFVTVLAVDRVGAEILAKPRLLSGRSTYRGVIFVADASPARTTQDLAKSSVAIVRTTTGGNLFLISEMSRLGMFSDPAISPRLMWVGTHDDVIGEVLAGRADAGAVKDVRLDEYLAGHPEVRVRRLAQSAEVPENAFAVRADLPDAEKARLKQILLGMSDDPSGAKVLQEFGASAFVACHQEEYDAVFDMIDQLGGRWELVGIEGPPPRRFAARGPSATTGRVR